jgi:hypothetical protein
VATGTGSIRVQPVQHITYCECKDYDQQHRFDAHATPPNLLHVGDIETKNSPGNVTELKYLPSVAKIPPVGGH